MNAPEFNEHVFVRKAQQGDPHAFEVLIKRYERYVYNLALRVVRDPQEAEDLAQLAFVQAWRGLPRFRGEARFSTWLYRIVTNLCYNRLPQIRRDLCQLIPDDDALYLPDEHQQVEVGVLDTELNVHLHQAIDDLPESYRLLITLRHLQEMSYEEIAQVTGTPLGTVKTGIFRARRLLREAIQHYEGEVVYERA